MKEFLLGVGASLLAAILFPAVSIWGNSLLARLFGWLPLGKRNNLSGRWKSTWHVQSSRFPPTVIDKETNVKHFWSHFFAHFHAESVELIATGNVDAGRYVTGVWKDRTEGGYHGAYQLIIDPHNKNKMIGTWVGFSTSGVVKNGLWEWEKVGA